jgi:hypothetical protein
MTMNTVTREDSVEIKNIMMTEMAYLTTMISRCTNTLCIGIWILKGGYEELYHRKILVK